MYLTLSTLHYSFYFFSYLYVIILKDGLIKMQSRKIDERYYIKVSDLMEPYPRPRRRLFAVDDHMPIILVETEI